METMKISKRILLLILIISIYQFVYSQPIHKWDVYSVSFTSAKTYANPYADIPVVKGGDLLKVTFTGMSGEALNKALLLSVSGTGDQSGR
jgi:hypothetical protein